MSKQKDENITIPGQEHPPKILAQMSDEAKAVKPNVPDDVMFAAMRDAHKQQLEKIRQENLARIAAEREAKQEAAKKALARAKATSKPTKAQKQTPPAPQPPANPPTPTTSAETAPPPPAQTESAPPPPADAAPAATPGAQPPWLNKN